MMINNLQNIKHSRLKIASILFSFATITFGLNFAIALPIQDLQQNKDKQIGTAAGLCPKTILSAPLVTTLEVEDKSFETVTLNANVNPENSPTTYWFEYGEDKYLNNNTGFVYAGQENKNQKVSINIRNLRPNTVYFYKVVSENQFGETSGESLSFKTLN